MKSSRPGVGPLEVLEEEDRRGPLGDALEEDPPGGEQDVATAGRRRLEAQQREEGRLDPAAIVVAGTYSATVALIRSRVVGFVVRLGQASPPADHLAERPERDPLAVGRRPAAVPVDRLADPVDELLELPGKARLADAARSRDRDEAGPPIAPRRLVTSLSSRNSSSRPTNGGSGRSERPSPRRWATTRRAR